MSRVRPPRYLRRPHPFLTGLAARAAQLLLPLLLQAERPIEQERGGRLGLAAPALELHRFLRHELRPREQRLLRLPGLGGRSC